LSEEDRALAKQRRRVLSLFFFGCEEKSVYSIIIHRSVSSLSLSLSARKKEGQRVTRAAKKKKKKKKKK
jgi:hypothetical protein